MGSVDPWSMGGPLARVASGALRDAHTWSAGGRVTTIAYRYGVLASDSRVTSGCGHIEPGVHRKLYKLPDGSLYAWVGSVGQGLAVLKALADDEDDPIYTNGPTCIRVSPKGSIEVYEGDGVWLPHPGSYGAWGSGREYAYG